MDLTLDQLRILAAVADTGSFAAAAAQVHRVPSAVSYQMKQLEQSLGLTLFDRSKRQIALTDQGRAVLAHARRILRNAEALTAEAAELATGWEPELRVVADGALPMTPIIGAIAWFSQQGLPTRIHLDVAYREGVLERFDAEDAHLMLCVGFDPDDDTSPWSLWDLPPLPMTLVCAPSHPLATMGPLVRTDADGFPELTVRDSARRFRHDPSTSFTGSRRLAPISDFHAKRTALLAGLGFGWMPDHLIAADLAAGALVGIAIDGIGCWTYQPKLCARAGRPVGRAARAFVERLGATP